MNLLPKLWQKHDRSITFISFYQDSRVIEAKIDKIYTKNIIKCACKTQKKIFEIPKKMFINNLCTNVKLWKN